MISWLQVMSSFNFVNSISNGQRKSYAGLQGHGIKSDTASSKFFLSQAYIIIVLKLLSVEWLFDFILQMYIELLIQNIKVNMQ